MKVFISHSFDSREAALKLARALEERGLEPWTSARLEPGKDWRAAITQAVSESQGFLFLVGPQSQEDRWLQVEWQAILESDWDRVPQRPMIPILFGDIAVPPFLAGWVAFRADRSMDLPLDSIVRLLLHPEEAQVPVNYAQARQEQKQRLDAIEQFALSLKLASQQPKGHYSPR